jgi:hypothetical protein
MKNKIKILALAISAIALSHAAMAQTTVPFDDLVANVGTNGAYNKSIVWLTSTYGSGIGHKIYSDDYSGQTYLKFAAKHSGQYSNGWKDMMTLTSLGKVGIGTSSPSVALAVEAEENQTTLGLNTSSAIRVSNQYVNAFGRRSELQFGTDQNPNNTLAVIAAEYSAWNSDVAGDLVFGTNPTQSTSVVERMRITHEGKVNIKGQTKIGTKSSTAHSNAMLMVDGKVVCKDLYVTASSDWPDFVFEKNYQLTNLYAVRDYYEANKHLPNVPTACEIEEKGINMSEMSAIQMQKIEELTIYIIQLKTELDELKKQLPVKTDTNHD